MKIFRSLSLVLALITISACAHVSTPVSYDQWLGRWDGPEGTFLFIARNGASYKMVIRDLDRDTVYYGNVATKGIQFQRNGKVETIHAGNGKETGMKWLADKKNCLVLHEGEGYCRN